MEEQELLFVNSQRHAGTWLKSSVHLGVGVFETMRAMRGARKDDGLAILIAGFEEHIDRLYQGSAAVQLNAPDRDMLVNTCKEILSAFDWKAHSDAIMRIVVLTDDWLVQLSPWTARHDVVGGIDVITFSGERPYPEVKTCSTIVSHFAMLAAKAQGASEALLVDHAGIVREGSCSNFFWIDQNETLYTTASKVLRGVTRQAVLRIAAKCLAEASIVERDCTREEIRAEAREAFITQSSHGVVPIKKIDDLDLPMGPITALIREAHLKYISQSSILLYAA